MEYLGDGPGGSHRTGEIAMHGDLRMIGPASCEGGFAVENTMTLTDENGDVLTLTVQDESCPISTPGVYHGTGRYVVTGGTGRYARATGKGVFDGHGDLAHGRFSASLSGSLGRLGK